MVLVAAHGLPFCNVLFLLTLGISSVSSLHTGEVDGVTQFNPENDAVSSFTSASVPELQQGESDDVGKVSVFTCERLYRS